MTASTPELIALSARRRWAALAVLMLPVLLVSVDNTALSFAIPSLTRHLEPTGNELLWIIDIYPLVLAALLVTMGSLGDRIGRRRLLLVGGAGFGVVSVLAAFSPNAPTLIVARAVLGIFGAMLMPATLSLIRNIFVDANERRTAVAVWAAGFSGGAVLGPMVGGWLLEHFWWGSVFLLAIPMLLPLLVLGPVLLPESRDPAPGPIDPVGIALVSTSLGAIVFAIKAVSTGEPIVLVAVTALVGLAAGTGFVHRMLEVERPMLDVRLFLNPVFSGALFVNAVSLFAMVGFIYFLTQHLQLVAGHSPLAAASLMLPGMVITIVCGLLAVPLVRMIGAGRVVMLGLAFNALGYFVASALGTSGSQAWLLTAFALVGVGVGLAETISNDLALSAAPPAKAGAASAVSETAYEVGSVLGTALLGSLLNLAYRSDVEMPRGVWPEDAAHARETLGGAVEVASDLPSHIADRLLDSAFHAFDGAVGLTAMIGALVTCVAIVVSRRAFRGL